MITVVVEATGREFDLTQNGTVLVQEAEKGSDQFGWCPYCGSRGLYRQVTPGGKDGCEKGHAYWTAMAVRENPKTRKKINQKSVT